MKESKRDIQSISARVAKHVSEKVEKAEVNLSYSLWIDYNNWLSIVLNIIYVLGRFSLFYINFLTCFMIFSIFCSICSKSTYSMKPNGNASTRKYYFILKLKFAYYNNIFGKVFHFKSNRPNNATVWEAPMLKKYFSSWTNYFPVWHSTENQVFTFSALFPCFSVFTLFEIMQLVKTSCKTSWRHLERRKIVTLKTSWRRLKDMSWTRLEDMSWRRLEDMSWRPLKDFTETNKILTGDTCILISWEQI